MTLPFGQQSFPEIYEQALVQPLFRPFAERLVDEIRPAPGERVLDVACGTGIVARLARERLGRNGAVVGVDVNAGMLAVARRVAADIEWREGDATALPVGEGEQFDVVTCHQGLQFFADRLAALRHMRRAMKPGGRLAIGTWRPEDEVPFGRALREVAERRVGPIMDRRHSLGDSAAVAGLLTDAGFGAVRCDVVSHPVRFADGNVFVRLNAMALVGMSAAGKDMDEAERSRAIEAIVQDSAPVLRDHTDADGLRFDIATTLATATSKPN